MLPRSRLSRLFGARRLNSCVIFANIKRKLDFRTRKPQSGSEIIVEDGGAAAKLRIPDRQRNNEIESREQT